MGWREVGWLGFEPRILGLKDRLLLSHPKVPYTVVSRPIDVRENSSYLPVSSVISLYQQFGRQNVGKLAHPRQYSNTNSV